MVFATVTGLRFTDPNSISSPSELLEGSSGILIFEVPEGSQIKELSLVYSHRASWEDDSPPQRGEMSLALD